MTTDAPVTIIGAGCSGLSLAKDIAKEQLSAIEVLSDKPSHNKQDHIWGFWQMPWLSDATMQAHHSWSHWHIITQDHRIAHHSTEHPYQMLSSARWLSYCRTQSGIDEVIGTVTDTPAAPYFDSRPLPAPKNCLYQHFLGHNITAETDIFDPTTAILMDFRCDQSQGLHFIYLLPTSPRTALVESTLFTATPLPDAYYEGAIAAYLARHYPDAAYNSTTTEKGIIPLAECRDKQNPDTAIGARGGALRPSSGYAFALIQKQVSAIITHYKATKKWQARPPISSGYIWMDKVFLHVLKAHPTIAISLFSKMALALTGDEFARFMSGTPSWGCLVKIILAMPKRPFLQAALMVMIGRG